MEVELEELITLMSHIWSTNILRSLHGLPFVVRASNWVVENWTLHNNVFTYCQVRGLTGFRKKESNYTWTVHSYCCQIEALPANGGTMQRAISLYFSFLLHCTRKSFEHRKTGEIGINCETWFLHAIESFTYSNDVLVITDTNFNN